MAAHLPADGAWIADIDARVRPKAVVVTAGGLAGIRPLYEALLSMSSVDGPAEARLNAPCATTASGELELLLMLTREEEAAARRSSIELSGDSLLWRGTRDAWDTRVALVAPLLETVGYQWVTDDWDAVSVRVERLG